MPDRALGSNLPFPRLPARRPDSHKGDFGRALLIGGSRGMAGAIALAGMAALRSGTGLVTLAVPDACLETVAGFEPSYMTVSLPSDLEGRLALAAYETIAKLSPQATAIACGPGLSRSPEITALVGRIYAELANPVVVDADGLNALAEQPDVLSAAGGPRILTPHPGEFARLSGETSVPPESRADRARELAARSRAIIVLKGHRTLITDGTREAVNETGNPGMATGGTGDVLTGVITALLCQGLSPFDAAQLGVHVHGLAGDIAAQSLGQISLIASDLVRHLPEAFLRLE